MDITQRQFRLVCNRTNGHRLSSESQILDGVEHQETVLGTRLAATAQWTRRKMLR